MATYDQAGPGGGAYPKSHMANATNWAGALVSLALVAGIGVWSYKLVMRDVSGIPVVQATEGPMRVAPEDPGGQFADHQGLSVNEVAGNGTASAPADTLTLAPRPVDLTTEDLPRRDIVPSAQPGPSERTTDASLSRDAEPPALSTQADLGLSTPDAPPATVSDDPIQALADQIAAGLDPVFTTPAPESAPVVTSLGTASETAVADAQTPRVTGGLGRSLRPQLRPAGLQSASLSPATPAVAAQTAELDPDSLPNGTRLVQFGAYDSPEVARSEWARLETRFGDYLDGKSRVIQRATSGGRVFYRLRAHGFEDMSDARRFCAAFVADNADCIPVVSR